ncbi:hypothetical protein B9T36_07140 [Acinetobacter sp. ANC 4204]|uniref:hypothetical protein n=1 Tax=Acinetobacter sp. ANC 4204 TaxID=1977884 RepID=UPI000A32E5C3|nr:hypothetical protein [Acinetobacter sp. ANC 4204]OTG60388.1 hypothetical protein B9T36_07140 [Acinetobacter sp. ANC 4204]
MSGDVDDCSATSTNTKPQNQAVVAGTYSLSFEITEAGVTSTRTATYVNTKTRTLGMLMLRLLAEIDLGSWASISPTYQECTALFTFSDVSSEAGDQSKFGGLDETTINGITTSRPIDLKIIQTVDPDGEDLYDLIFGNEYVSNTVHSCGYSLVAGEVI